MLTDNQLVQYERDGFVVVKNLFNEVEAELLLKIALADAALEGPATDGDQIDPTRPKPAQVVRAEDGQGRDTKFWVDDNISDDYYSAIARSRRVVEPIEQMLEGEAYHWHHKIMLKSARTGGAFNWHQDFGYWQKNGNVLFPYMASCMIAVNRTTKINGCLQALAGSHHIGLIQHERVNSQQTADADRVAAAVERLPLVHLELEPGSGVFFHCNLLHRSDPNDSDEPRWTLICCYNAARNDPYRDSHHPRYTPLARLEDDEILRIGRAQWERMTERGA